MTNCIVCFISIILQKYIIFLFCIFCCNSCYAARIKDIAIVQGVRDNILQGYGLVSGLASTGDNLQNSLFTKKELKNLLSRFNVDIDFTNVKTKNTASVIVTATLPSFAKPGRKIDVKVSALGDAVSLYGGVLLPTQLIGPDGNTYAIAQGIVQVQKFVPASNQVRTSVEPVLTNGWINSGAIVELGLDYSIDSFKDLKVIVHNPDFTTCNLIAEAINSSIIGNLASAVDSATVLVTIPVKRKKDIVKLISEIDSNVSWVSVA